MAGLAALAGCDKQASSPGAMNFRHNPTGAGTPIATFHDDSITAEELEKRFEEMSPFARTRFQSIDQRKEYVDGLVRFELLAREAAARGLQNDPDVIEEAKKVMVQKLIKKEFDEKSTPISDEDVAAWYEKHKDDYVKPEMLRLSHIFLKADAGDASRAEKKKQADELVKQARALQPLDYAGFGKLVEAHSEEPRTKPLRGDMRYLSNEELAKEYGTEVAEAAKKLGTTIGIVSEVVETPTGFHVLKLQGRQAALNLGVDQVKTQIQARLLYERRTEAFNTFVENLKVKAKLQVHEAPLSKIEIDLKAPPKGGTDPQRGFMPAPAPAGALAPHR